MSDRAMDLLAYYAQPGIIIEPKEHAHLLQGLPSDVSGLREIVQGLLLHVFWAERYGVELSEERKQEVGIRTVSAKLARIRELCAEPLLMTRPLEQRLVGNCRDFSVLLCTLLQHHGVPARARCGFGAYFLPDHYEDHWVCEYWNVAQGRWMMADAQLDAFQREVLNIQFDPLDVPRDQFLVGGKAWQMCRAGQADPDKFGILDMHGMWFIRGDLVRDFLALNKVEILPWDGWGDLITPDEELPPEEMAFFDRLAALTLAGDEAFPELRALYEQDVRLRMPPDWAPESGALA